MWKQGSLRSSQVHKALTDMQDNIAFVTVKRALARMAKAGLLSMRGAGRSTAYVLTISGRMHLDIDSRAYCDLEPDLRYGSAGFNFNLFSAAPVELFTEYELAALMRWTDEYRERAARVSQTMVKKELERLVIEFSWKSSKIEGNTYTLLDTEKLIREHRKAKGHSESEAQMILNHKEAFTLIYECAGDFRSLTRANMESIHGVIVKNLGVNRGLRQSPVGITGSSYRPLDTVHQITDAIDSLSHVVRRMQSPYAKALIALLGISYIQPFEDGNKRTSRIMANALLLAHGCAPLSYRSVDEEAYRDAIIVFYELNSIMPFKRIFIEQYDFAARNYAV